MQEKFYIITAKTKGENPMVLFLNGAAAWSKYAPLNTLLENLHMCQAWAEAEPTHYLFVEAKDSLRKELKDIMNSEKDFVTPAELKQLIEKHSCHTVSTKKKKEKPAKEEAREYVLYYSPLYSAGYVYYLRGDLETKNKNEAYLMTLAEAEAKLQEKGHYKWLIKKQAAKIEPHQPTPYAAEDTPQKRIGYVLSRYSNSVGGKLYKRNTGLNVKIGDGYADVFMTEKQAHFACYAYNRDYGSNRWQVEQIEF